mmetsp:Transcript_8843/g.14006  ORF Transcript_8843/g.14006 Transcript_8843/m.14006 type:complete len:86 (-) Transcript_8843:734-991(-)
MYKLQRKNEKDIMYSMPLFGDKVNSGMSILASIAISQSMQKGIECKPRPISYTTVASSREADYLSLHLHCAYEHVLDRPSEGHSA